MTSPIVTTFPRFGSDPALPRASPRGGFAPDTGRRWRGVDAAGARTRPSRGPGRAQPIHCRQPPGANTLWYGLYRPQQRGAGIELGSLLLLGQFSLERGALLLGLCEPGRRAADLRDEFVKGGAVHCSPHVPMPSPHSATPKIA